MTTPVPRWPAELLPQHQSVPSVRMPQVKESPALSAVYLLGSGLFVPEVEIRERTLAEARHYGLLAGVRYGEPFVQKEVGLVDDLMLIPVASI